ncbi:MAG: GGDEF domain-containing protein [Acidobacteriia bacterium]|nr:GGDEF domain-containing protein [Terriglobia bacterium]
MISIQNSLTELQRCHQLRDQALDCYLSAIRNVADYAIELDDGITGPHRQYLTALAGEVAAGTPEVLERSRATLRGLLRDYRGKAAQYLKELREELAGAADALQKILDSMAQTDGDQEFLLHGALGRLREISDSPHATAVREVVLAAAEAIEQSVEQIRQQHQLTVTQFLVEIRVLHKRIDALETAASIDGVTRLLNRGEVEDLIRSAPGRECRLLLLKVPGLRLAERRFSAGVAAELAGAFARRLRNSLPPDTVLGRWREEEFVGILALANPEAMAKAKWIAEHLSGDYACLKDGKAVHPKLQIGVAVLDASGEAPKRTLARVEEFLSGK